MSGQFRVSLPVRFPVFPLLRLPHLFSSFRAAPSMVHCPSPSVILQGEYFSFSFLFMRQWHDHCILINMYDGESLMKTDQYLFSLRVESSIDLENAHNFKCGAMDAEGIAQDVSGEALTSLHFGHTLSLSSTGRASALTPSPFPHHRSESKFLNRNLVKITLSQTSTTASTTPSSGRHKGKTATMPWECVA